KLQWIPDSIMAGPDTTPPVSPGPSIFTAVQEQLGLRLEPQKGPGEVFLVGGAGKTSKNLGKSRFWRHAGRSLPESAAGFTYRTVGRLVNTWRLLVTYVRQRFRKHLSDIPTSQGLCSGIEVVDACQTGLIDNVPSDNTRDMLARETA